MDYVTPVREYLEYGWSLVLEFFGNDEKTIFVLGTSMALFIPFCAINSLFMFLDFTGKPKFLHRYKVQKDKNIPVDPKRFIECCKVAFRNELMSCFYIFLLYPVMKACGMSYENPLPPLWKTLIHYYVFGLVSEFIFYYSHRLFHHPALYKHIHKKHHEWIAPISVATSYTHPIEHLISNQCALYVGPLLVGSHLSLFWYWLVLAQIDASLHHCNYHLPFLTSPQFHDYHHLKFNECYGTNGLLDWFHGTDVTYQESVQSKRHMVYYKMAPITEIIPSANEKEN